MINHEGHEAHEEEMFRKNFVLFVSFVVNQ